MDTEHVQRKRSVFASLEKTPALLGYQLLRDGDPVDDTVLQVACVHSIAISLRRIADALEASNEQA